MKMPGRRPSGPMRRRQDSTRASRSPVRLSLKVPSASPRLPAGSVFQCLKASSSSKQRRGNEDMTTKLSRPDGEVQIEELPDGRRLVSVKPSDKNLFIPIASCETSYPIALIQHILDIKGIAWSCDEISRDENPKYIRRSLENDLFAYFDRGDFSHKRILDFGCGSGASTAILARMFPDAEIVGVELLDDLLSIARKRIEHYGFANVELRQSQDGTQLPDNLGQFDFVILSAVFEHLLPDERTIVPPKIWSLLRGGGYLFINQTPNRLFPFELHTTMLPLINYLPRQLAFAAARRFSKRIDKNDSWESLLRQGIRGATVREILRVLPKRDGKPILLEPSKSGLKDRIDLWSLNTNPERMARLKSTAKIFLKIIKFMTGVSLVSDLSLAIKKG